MRSFTARDLITLPRLNAVEADAQIETLKALGSSLPVAIDRSRKRVVTAHAALEVVTRPQRNAPDRTVRRKADRKIDNAWSATFDWLTGWCRLPDEDNPHRANAGTLFKLAFPGDSLSFTRLPYKMEWKESESRINAIHEGKHDEIFKHLGGESFWAHIQKAHKEYGIALGITEVKPADPGAPDIRTVFDATCDALRDYANRVAAHGDPEEPGSEALSTALLKPLVEWESRRSAGAGEDDETDDTTGSTTPGEATPGEAPKNG